jgi:2-aminoethylphosphonate-pyruvate transaminase
MNNGIVDEIKSLFETYGGSLYGGEAVTQLEHALQTAMLAESEGADAALIVAALLHDVGHLLHDLPDDAPDAGVDDVHEELAYHWLRGHFGPAVTEPVRLHVDAKRYLCAVEPAYWASLSPVSQQSLELQGGTFTAEETRDFEKRPFFEQGVRLRRWDDQAKVVGLVTPSLNHFLSYIHLLFPAPQAKAERGRVSFSTDDVSIGCNVTSRKRNPTPCAAHDKTLFTPGPLTTSRTIKQAMLRDLGSRDDEFIGIVRRVRNRLLAVAGLSQQAGYECVPMQGSGTFSVEAVISSAMPRKGKLLVIINGAYGERILAIAQRYGIETITIRAKENALPDVAEVARVLAAQKEIKMTAVVHCETTSGIINPIQAIGEAVHRHGSSYFVDSMSAFGAIPVDMPACHIDFLVSSANKCIEGVPGFGFVICRRAALLATEGLARTVSLDLLAQWQGLERNGQFRFTPPTHALLAFDQALVELGAEGGVAGRGERYRANYETLCRGMREMGFSEYVPERLQGYIITSYRYPTDPRFDFDAFYNRLSDKGFVIYPGKVTDADCFRIATVGRIFPSDVSGLLGAIRDVFTNMGIKLPLES